MGDLVAALGQMKISQADHLPVAAAFLDRMGVAATVNAAVPTEMAVDLGSIIKLMVLDTLSGRSPLYRLEDFASAVDTGLLLGKELDPSAFNDTTLGRALDAVYAAGTEQLFSQVALGAASAFSREVDMRHVHFDTTSVSVWGDYAMCGQEEEAGEGEDEGGRMEKGAAAGLKITYGYSKDRRPDLKQFLIKMLCVHRNIPVLGGCADGNASDKVLNNKMLTALSCHMARHGIGEGAFVYISDSAMVTPANLEAISGNLFITRLPATYSETGRVVQEAVEEGIWTDVEDRAPSSGRRKAASYRVSETTVDLYGRGYRAVVAHSDAGDKRRQKKLDRMLAESREAAQLMLRAEEKVEYFCREDAEAAATRLRSESPPYHYCSCAVAERPTYARGRPPKSGERKIAKMMYGLAGEVAERESAVERARAAAGCFVLLTNVPASGEMAHTGAEVPAAYKEQHGIERNFGFLKDPLIVNDLFLKRPDRIEVLGFVLLVSLLAWSLAKHVMRSYLARTDSDIIGWDKKMTRKPTTFMMTTKFKGLLVARIGDEWFLTAPFTKAQQQFVQALGLSEEMILRKSAGSPPGQKLPGNGL
jgi:transposase